MRFISLFCMLGSGIFLSACVDNDQGFASRNPTSSYQTARNNSMYQQDMQSMRAMSMQALNTYDALANTTWYAVGQNNKVLRHNYIHFEIDRTFNKSYFDMVIDEPTKPYQRQRFVGSFLPTSRDDGYLNAFFYRPVACSQSSIQISPPQKTWHEGTVRSIDVNIQQSCVGALFPNIYGAAYIDKPLTFLSRDDLFYEDLL